MTSINELIDGATGPGRKTVRMTAAISRTLTPEDLMELGAGGAGVPVPTIKELRASHHKLAQTLAKGAGNNEASAITGYSCGRIVQLKADPQFQELLTYYQAQDDQAFLDLNTVIKERLASLSLDTIEIAHSRLLDNPESFSAKELAAIAELGLDRIGHGKTSTQQVAHTHSVDEDQLARIRAAQDNPANVSEEDRAALVSLALFATGEHSSAQEAEGLEGERGGLREEGRERTSEAARTTIDLSPVAVVSPD